MKRFPQPPANRLPANRLGQCSFIGPSETSSSVDMRGRDTQLLSPGGSGLRPSVECHQSISAPITSLRSTRIPLHVSRFIAAIVVNAFNCVFRRRTWAYVCVERREVIYPRFIHCDSAPAISSIGIVGRIQTSSFDVRPNSILRAVRHVVCNRVRFSWALPARLDASAAKMGRSNHRRAAAVTKALPISLPVAPLVLAERFDNKFTEGRFDRYDDSSWQVLVSIKNVLVRPGSGLTSVSGSSLILARQ